MPDHEQTSPWSPQAHRDAYEARAAPPTAEQPAHAWMSADPYGAQASSAPAATVGAVATAPAPTPIEVRVAAPPAAGRGLAVLGVVLGGLALLGLGLVLVLVMFLGFMSDPSSDGGGSGTVRGRLTPTGGALTGTALADEITKQLNDQGEEPAGISCPRTVKVTQDVTTVCHGTDFGTDTAFVVFFEDDGGSYTLLEV